MKISHTGNIKIKIRGQETLEKTLEEWWELYLYLRELFKQSTRK